MSVFARVAELGSFSAAALDRNLTPSAVSKLVTRLEDRLGVKLFARTTRSLTLTDAGDRYLARVQDILRAIEEAETEIAVAGGAEPSGTLRVNTGPTFGRHRLMRVLPQFLQRHPKIELRLDITDRQVDLAADRVDVAIRTGPLSDSRLVARKIMDADRVICASPDYVSANGAPTTPDDLAAHKCLLISDIRALSEWPFKGPHGNRRVKIRAHASSDNADLVRDMALAGLGIARVIRYTVQRELADGRLVPILAKHHIGEPTPVSAVMLPERRNAPAVRAFVNFLTEAFDAGS